MKKLRRVCMYLAWIGMLSLPLFSFAGEGDGKGNGGDPISARREALKKLIQGNLKLRVRTYFQNIDLANISDTEVSEELSHMISHDLDKDVIRSKYVIRSVCLDENRKSQPATSVNGQRGGDICLNVKKLAESSTSEQEMVGLLAHEHAHHYGYRDTEHRLMNAVIDTLSLGSGSGKAVTCTAYCMIPYWQGRYTRLVSAELLEVSDPSSLAKAWQSLSARCRVLNEARGTEGYETGEPVTDLALSDSGEPKANLSNACH